MIPLRYNVRNLRVRWVTTLLTVLATALVVGSACMLFGLVDGLKYSLRVSGDPLDVLILRQGSTSETNGGFDTTKAEQIVTMPGIARDESGKPMAALERLNIPVVERKDGSRANIIIRGGDLMSPKLRPDFKIIQGRYLTPGKDECIVSRNISRRFKGAELNGTLRCGEKEAYRVVGIFTAGGSAAESEVWVDRKDLERNTAYDSYVSSVQVRATSPATRDELIKKIADDPQFKLKPDREIDFYEKQQSSAVFLEVLGGIIAVLLTLGAMFAAANTMFAAVKSRTREIGTMRALGFSQFDVLVSFLGESILLATLGGLLGALATIPLGSMLSFGTSDINTFSERTIQFRFGAIPIAVAFAMTFAMGVFGGLFPALRAVRLDTIKALREL